MIESLFTADDMGLGKTLTIISLLMRHRELVEDGTITEDFSSLKKDEEDSDNDEKEEEESAWIQRKGINSCIFSCLLGDG